MSDTTFKAWMSRLANRLDAFELDLTCDEPTLNRLFNEKKSLGFVVANHTVERVLGTREVHGARENDAPSEVTDRLLNEPVGVHSHEVFKSGDGTHKHQKATVRQAKFTGVPLEERVLDPECPLDDKILFAWETLRIAKGQLAFATRYADRANFVIEYNEVVEKIKGMHLYLEKLRTYHEQSGEIRPKLAAEVLELESKHRELVRARAEKKAELERERAKRSGRVVVEKAPKERKKLSRDEVLVKYGITSETISQMKQNGLDPEAMISRMM